jgi:hypothetical protein
MVDLSSSFVWSELDEAGRYEVWSAHIEAGGQDFTYPAFCDAMDLISTTA